MTVALKDLVRGLGKCIEWFGDKTRIYPIEKLGKWIQDACHETSKQVSQTRSYDQNTATVDETEQIAEMLSKFSRSLHTQASDLENAARQRIDGFFDSIIGVMDGLIEGPIIRNLKAQKKLVSSSIDGKLLHVLSVRVSLSDPECISILKLASGEEKHQKMEHFGKKVIQEGLDSLCASLNQALDSACDCVEAELQELSNTNKNQLEKLMRQIQEIKNARLRDIYTYEDAILLPVQKLGASEAVLELLTGKGSL